MICDDLLEASIPQEHKHASTALAVDWTDVETFSRPPPRGTSDCADPEASWGHRSGGGPGQDSELFFGYYPSAATMMRDEHGPPVPELARRMTVCSCRHDPARALVPVLPRCPKTASASATSWPTPATPTATPKPGPSRSGSPARSWSRTCTRSTAAPAAPTTAPSSPTATSTARPRPARCWNSARSPATPPRTRPPPTTSRPPRPPGYKLGKITSDDADGYHRVMCPAAMGKIRCPLRPASMRLDRNRPEILTPPQHPPDCCQPADHHRPARDVAAKTAQKHDYPSKEHRQSYARRTGAERTFSTAKDPATNNIARGWTRLMGLAPIMLWLTCLLAVRNQRILAAWDARQADDARRAAAGLPPKTRRRRRKTLASLATAAPP